MKAEQLVIPELEGMERRLSDDELILAVQKRFRELREIQINLANKDGMTSEMRSELNQSHQEIDQELNELIGIAYDRGLYEVLERSVA